ncbi:PD-(D/E)XK nuclease family protein [Deinococcus sp. 6YEL10]|uniref:PD-(D/E)XK nuclease family protein n=1 Tax=Deinococcus sp. 6YEL10 TaxID=2745870 RepID=UPI001E480987|nr:PD-(D/E)XK nuclease family protein [Deinococcus sp. 6YEL10]MCD0159705.1 PD-(D/E)XK nuclease family protein [Deinococcus sp. 6YEL10]
MTPEDLNTHLIGKINTALLNQELSKRDGKGVNPYRASSAGKCPRLLAYGLHYPELAETPTARFAAVMSIGNALHGMISEWLRLAGIQIIEEEKTYEIEILPGVKMRPRLDWILRIQGERVIVDAKTKSATAFSLFQREGMSVDERAQLHVYSLATGIRRMAILGINKETGQLHIDYTEYDPSFMAHIRSLFRQVKVSTPDNLPERHHALTPHIKEYKTAKNTHRNEYEMRLPWQCRFCPYTEPCWAGEGIQTKEDGTQYRPMTDIERELALVSGGRA